MNQLEMFAPLAQKKVEMPTADSVRPRLDAILQQLRDGSALQWSKAEHRRWLVVFPQMCEWLPEAERELTRAEFLRLSGLSKPYASVDEMPEAAAHPAGGDRDQLPYRRLSER
jgi:hypothetical protein